jgi:threonine synthase
VEELRLPDPSGLAEKYGLKNLYCKMDSALPSGSFKDRASQLICCQAFRPQAEQDSPCIHRKLPCCNDCAGAAYGLEIILFVPATAPVEQADAECALWRYRRSGKGSYDDAFALSIAYTKQFWRYQPQYSLQPDDHRRERRASPIELFEQLGRKVPMFSTSL